MAISLADSILSITIRDTQHSCVPYQSTVHSFFVHIFTCDFQPLHWKGITYINYPLSTRGLGGGFIHGQLKVPPGCYVIRAVATCKNVVTDWAWVEVGCDETVCVNLLPPSVWDCIRRVQIGLQYGTVDPPEGEKKIRDLMAEEADTAVKHLEKIAAKLPKGVLPPPPEMEPVIELERKARSQK